MEAACCGQPIIQIHPTRRCNLRCLHCYSFSAPEERDQLSPQILEDVLEDAAALGYKVASFSGGEPVLYEDLGQLLMHAKELGFRTTVTSNGMLLDRKRMAMLTGCTDVLAISLDGVPESHNRMRASDEAFERMQANLERVRLSGITFGFIFTLTQFNVNEIDWAARFAVEQGARLLQIHPLEEVGRASQLLVGSRPDEMESAFAYLVAERLRQMYGDRLFVQLDIFHRDLVKRFPARFYADDVGPESAQLADMLTPLVVEADGNVAPLGYGFARRFGLGSIAENRLKDLAPEWIRQRYPAFRELCRDVYAEACAPSDLPFLNWYELIGERSAHAPAPAATRIQATSA
ncbi:MAG TPA: radical SAM protein [Bryobacteraceae bacterium]|nr:radical SAM protein [Bryobacteraceae bacterium]